MGQIKKNQRVSLARYRTAQRKYELSLSISASMTMRGHSRILCSLLWSLCLFNHRQTNAQCKFRWRVAQCQTSLTQKMANKRVLIVYSYGFQFMLGRSMVHRDSALSCSLSFRLFYLAFLKVHCTSLEANHSHWSSCISASYCETDGLSVLNFFMRGECTNVTYRAIEREHIGLNT